MKIFITITSLLFLSAFAFGQEEAASMRKNALPANAILKSESVQEDSTQSNMQMSTSKLHPVSDVERKSSHENREENESAVSTKKTAK